MEEIWKSIPNSNGKYEASSLGNIRSVGRYVKNNIHGGKRFCKPIILSQKTKSNGYKEVSLYFETQKGKLVRTYRNMKSRVEGILKKKSHLYEGLPILNKEVFYDWALSNKEYNMLFEEWEKSNYNLKLSPSIDRIDPLKGYTLCNMRWVSFQENCSNIRR